MYWPRLAGSTWTSADAKNCAGPLVTSIWPFRVGLPTAWSITNLATSTRRASGFFSFIHTELRNRAAVGAASTRLAKVSTFDRH